MKSTIVGSSGVARKRFEPLTPRFIATAAAVALAAGIGSASGAPSASNHGSTSDAFQVSYKTVEVDGIEIFYREAGDPARPTVLLLHGFPSSSHMFRNLIPLLGARFHVVAPDYPGSGFSEAPGIDRFEPTFAHLATVMSDFVAAVGLTSFTIYMQDFGGPVGLRLASERPDRVDGLVIQNANAYVEGIAPDILKDMKTRASGPLDAAADAGLDQLLSMQGTRFQYLTGAREPVHIDPTSYSVDAWIQAMPEQRRIQRALIVDYYDNVLHYPNWQRYLKAHQPRTLIVWGRNDPIFSAAGAEAYRADLPKAELHFYETGHFALEEDAVPIAQQILRFLDRGR